MPAHVYRISAISVSCCFGWWSSPSRSSSAHRRSFQFQQSIGRSRPWRTASGTTGNRWDQSALWRAFRWTLSTSAALQSFEGRNERLDHRQQRCSFSVWSGLCSRCLLSRYLSSASIALPGGNVVLEWNQSGHSSSWLLQSYSRKWAIRSEPVADQHPFDVDCGNESIYISVDSI